MKNKTGEYCLTTQYRTVFKQLRVRFEDFTAFTELEFMLLQLFWRSLLLLFSGDIPAQIWRHKIHPKNW
jgi:hypothetical protein